MRKLTATEFIAKATLVHNNKYDSGNLKYIYTTQ